MADQSCDEERTDIVSDLSELASEEQIAAGSRDGQARQVEEVAQSLADFVGELFAKREEERLQAELAPVLENLKTLRRDLSRLRESVTVREDVMLKRQLVRVPVFEVTAGLLSADVLQRALATINKCGVDVGDLVMVSSAEIIDQMVSAVARNYCDPGAKEHECLSRGTIPLYGYDIPIRKSRKILAQETAPRYFTGPVYFISFEALLDAVDQIEIRV